MTTQQVAERIVELFNQGKAVEAEQELYADNVVSHEQDERGKVKGKESIIAKTKEAFAQATTVHKASAKLVGVNHNTFIIHYDMDMELANGFRFTGSEFGFYELEDGKVVNEYFFAA